MPSLIDTIDYGLRSVLFNPNSIPTAILQDAGFCPMLGKEPFAQGDLISRWLATVTCRKLVMRQFGGTFALLLEMSTG